MFLGSSIFRNENKTIMKNITLAVFSLFLVSCKSEKPKTEKPNINLETYQKKEFKNTQGTLPYQILFPKDYDETQSYPLVLFLHGSGERGNDNEAQLTHGSDLFLKEELREKYPAIVVFPQCPEDSYWSNIKREEVDMQLTFTFYSDGEPTKAMRLLQDLIPELRNTYKIDENRIYVGGLSMGGMGTFEIVRRNPELFAAAFAICGGAHPDTAAELKNPAWWVFHGDADAVVDYSHSQNMVNAMKQEGINVKFTTYEGVNHNSWENAFAEPDLIPWLFSHFK